MTQEGGPAESCKSICIEGGVSYSGSAVVNPLAGISRQTAHPKLRTVSWIGFLSEHGFASLDNELSRPRPMGHMGDW